eukprot:SAG22_NODE_291_length_12933_cov_5.599657_6_plen_177_part_00
MARKTKTKTKRKKVVPRYRKPSRGVSRKYNRNEPWFLGRDYSNTFTQLHQINKYVINIKKFDASKVNVSEDMGKLNNGLKTMYVDYGDKKDPVRVQTPWMKMPFDPDEQDNDRRSICLNCNTDTFRDKLSSLDDIIINVSKEEAVRSCLDAGPKLTQHRKYGFLHSCVIRLATDHA